MSRFHNTIILKNTPEYDALKEATDRSLLEAKEQIERITAAHNRTREALRGFSPPCPVVDN